MTDDLMGIREICKNYVIQKGSFCRFSKKKGFPCRVVIDDSNRHYYPRADIENYFLENGTGRQRKTCVRRRLIVSTPEPGLKNGLAQVFIRCAGKHWLLCDALDRFSHEHG